MLIAKLVNTQPMVAFVLLFLLGIVAFIVGSKAYRPGRSGEERPDDGLVIDGVVGPVLGLFALMVAFTFGQALSLEASTYSDIVSAKLAVEQLTAVSPLLPEEPRGKFLGVVQDYSSRLNAAIAGNRLDLEGGVLKAKEVMMQRELLALDTNAKDVVLAELSGVSSAVRQLRVDSAQRIPSTVFGVQSLYYIVCFLLLGFKVAEHGIYRESRVFLAGLAGLFAVVMFMAINIGRPGLNPMFFDPLP